MRNGPGLSGRSLDRRALERSAIGAPRIPPDTGLAGRLDLPPHALRFGSPRTVRRVRRRPPRHAEAGAGARAAAGSPFLLLLGPGDHHARLLEAALRAASELGRPNDAVVLLDPPTGRPLLGEHLRAHPGEGLADVLLFGASLTRAVQRPPGSPFGYLAPGLFGAAGLPDPGSAAWRSFARTARRKELTLVVLLSGADHPDLPRLAPLASGVHLLGESSRLDEVRRAVPTGLAVLGEHPWPVDEPEAVAATAQSAEPDAGAGLPSPGRPAQEDGTAAHPPGIVEVQEREHEPEVPTPVQEEAAAVGVVQEEAEEAEEEEEAEEYLPADDLRLPPPPEALIRRPRPVVARRTIPETGPRRELVTRVAAVLILAYWSYYIGWRWAATLNLDALWFSVPLVLAETWGLLTAAFLVFSTWRLNVRRPRPAPAGRTVDVFITTYDEPLEIIRRTAVSARAIHYPHRTYVLDDGRREEIRAMAKELGIGYLRREDNEHAKAGNLNHALKQTDGEFILQLDADHAPLPHILDRLLGYFDDEKVAFVQTPQDFYNKDSFTTDVNEEEQRIWEEQRLFFSVIQPGKDSWNSAFFCGSCAVIRRNALAEIGGFSTESITEDIETSLLLHARGWRSVYHGESLAYGLAAGSAEAFHTQHSRWAQGAMQVLRRFNPLTYPGLSAAQRIGYFYSLSSYVVGLQKLIFYISPVVFFTTGVLPIRALDREFLIRFVPYLLLSILLVEMLSRGMGFTWIAERYQMAKFWTYTRALPAFLTRKPLRFRVTPKGAARVSTLTYVPHLILMGVTVVSVNWATFAYHYGWVDYGVPGWRSLAFQLNFLWAVVNFVLAAYVVRLSLRIQRQRQDHRFSDRFPIHVHERGEQEGLGEPHLALTEDLNASGLAFRSTTRFEPGTHLRIALPLSSEEVAVDGTVVNAHREAAADHPVHLHGVAFEDVPLGVRDAIELHCAQHAVPHEQSRYTTVGADVVQRAQGWVRKLRGEPRRVVRLASHIQLQDAGDEDRPRQLVGFLEELSRTAARLVVDEPVTPGTGVTFEVPGTGLHGAGEAVATHAHETPVGVRFAVTVRRDAGAGEHADAASRRLEA